jgi:hypothetical protein
MTDNLAHLIMIFMLFLSIVEIFRIERMILKITHAIERLVDRIEKR